MFLPMSCTSPFTVAMSTLPAYAASSSSSASLPAAARAAAFAASIKGTRYATAIFITRADLITCGRNILPAPNRSPTTDMPDMRGPSITFRGAAIDARASSVSCSMKSGMPFTSEYVRRSWHGFSRHSRPLRAAATAPPFLRASAASFSTSARASSRSVASGWLRHSTTSSTMASRSAGISLYTCSMPAFTMPMSMPAPIAWNRNTLCIASRITSTPRKPKDRLDTPPEILQPGHVALMRAVALIKSRP